MSPDGSSSHAVTFTRSGGRHCAIIGRVCPENPASESLAASIPIGSSQPIGCPDGVTRGRFTMSAATLTRPSMLCRRALRCSFRPRAGSTKSFPSSFATFGSAGTT